MNRKSQILRKLALATLLCWVFSAGAAFAQVACCDIPSSGCPLPAHTGGAGAPDGFASDTCHRFSRPEPIEKAHDPFHLQVHESRADNFCIYQACCSNRAVSVPAAVAAGPFFTAGAEKDACSHHFLQASLPVAETHFFPFYPGPLYLQKHSLII